jgi:hypothetical protein
MLSSASLGVGSSGAHEESVHYLWTPTHSRHQYGSFGRKSRFRRDLCGDIIHDTQGREETALRPQRRKPRRLYRGPLGLLERERPAPAVSALLIPEGFSSGASLSFTVRADTAGFVSPTSSVVAAARVASASNSA